MYSSIQSVFTKVKDSIGSYLFSSSKKNNNTLIQHDEQYQTSSPQCNELQPELTLDEDVNPEQPKSICNTPSFYLNKKEQYLYPNDYGFNKHNRKLNLNELNEIQHSNCSSSEHETHSIIANANKFTSTINNNSDRKLLGNKNVLRDNTVDDVDNGDDSGNNKRKMVDNVSKTVKESESVNESDKDNTFVKLFEQRKKILEEFKKQQNDKKNIIINYYTPSHNPRFNHLSLEYSKQIYIPSKQKESKVESKNNNNNNKAVTAVSSREKETKKEEKSNNNSTSSSSKVTFCAPQNQPKYKSIFTTETSDSKVTFGFSSEKKVEEPKKEKGKTITNDSSNNNNNNKPLFGFVNSEQKEYKSIFDNNTNSKSTVTFGFKEDKKNNDTHINTKEEQTVPPKETKSNNLFESQKTTTTTKSLFDSPIKTTEPKPAVAVATAAVSTKNNSLFTNPPEPKLTFDSSTTTTSLFSNTTTTQTKSLFEQSPNPKSLFTFGKSLFDNSESSSTKETTTSFSKPSLFSSTTTTTSQPLNLFSTSTSSSTPTTSLFTSSTSLFTSSKPTTTDTQPQQGLFSNIPKSTLFTSSSDNKKFEFSFGKK